MNATTTNRGVRPSCMHCDKPLRAFRYRDHPDINNDGKRKWGDYGDNIFCGKTCGYWYALQTRFAKSHGRA